jgi:iron-sulfur cluster assembly protein
MGQIYPHNAIMIEISKAALSEIKRMQKVRDRVESKLRLGVAIGGCNDFYYTIDLATSIDSEDVAYEANGISVLIDRQYLAYLDRLKLDYSEDLMGGGFRFQNPQAASVCGCGNSFSLAEPLVSSIVNPVETERWQLPT